MSRLEHNPIVAKLAEAVLAGRQAAVARAITLVEEGGLEAQHLLHLLQGQAPSDRRTGITGPPGTGKSTLVNALAIEIRKRQPQSLLGIIAVDPSSPFSGGAVLGDRMRMAELAEDAGVFIRSMASRGALGGLSEATEGGCDVLSAAGYGHLIVETVGVGQNEVDIASACETTIVVVNPESGDSVQAVKAGLMEVADIVVVNKADHPRTQRFLTDLSEGLELRAHGEGPFWQVPVLPTIATRGEGVAELATALEAHEALLTQHQLKADRRRMRVCRRIESLAFALLRHRVRDSEELRQQLEVHTDEVLAGQASIYAAARAFLAGLARP